MIISTRGRTLGEVERRRVQKAADTSKRRTRFLSHRSQRLLRAGIFGHGADRNNVRRCCNVSTPRRGRPRATLTANVRLGCRTLPFASSNGTSGKRHFRAFADTAVEVSLEVSERIFAAICFVSVARWLAHTRIMIAASRSDRARCPTGSLCGRALSPSRSSGYWRAAPRNSTSVTIGRQERRSSRHGPKVCIASITPRWRGMGELQRRV
jgi:hypothetical protein